MALPLVAHAPFVGNITFDPRGELGLYEDVVTFHFTTVNGTFTIRRSLWATVHVQADADRHVPTPPFAVSKKKARRARFFQRGPKISDGAKIPWVIELGHFPVPADLQGLAEDFGDAARIDAARSTGLLPLSLNVETHKQYFQFLLWVEELQRRWVTPIK